MNEEHDFNALTKDRDERYQGHRGPSLRGGSLGGSISEIFLPAPARLEKEEPAADVQHQPGSGYDEGGIEQIEAVGLGEIPNRERGGKAQGYRKCSTPTKGRQMAFGPDLSQVARERREHQDGFKP